ncbi:MAG: carbohydrate binding family 9 domain-containing protein, partial [Pyrinomonadaceae bacterium]
MKKLYVLIALLVFAINGFGQPSAAAPAANGNGNGSSAAGPKPGKVEIPPEKARPVNIPLISAGPVIDGRLDDDAWKQASVFNEFYQTYPGDNIAPSRPTEVLMMYDEHHLYVAFKCWDEKDKIRATVAKRDNVFGEDNVRIWLDTFNDQRRAYVFGFNPLGIQQDGIYTEGQGADFSVDVV